MMYVTTLDVKDVVQGDDQTLEGVWRGVVDGSKVVWSLGLSGGGRNVDGDGAGWGRKVGTCDKWRGYR